MIRLNPRSPICRRTLAAMALLGLGMMPLAAQPLNPPAANDADTTNGSVPTVVNPISGIDFRMPTGTARFPFILAEARFQASTREYGLAETNFIKLLAADVPVAMQQTALFELAQVVAMENDLPRAQSIYTQYLQRWPGDVRTPDIYLRQGQVFRQMDLPSLALAKFYGVMTTALSLKDGQLD
jgi:TolA-binding protein